jgi:rhamnose transport system permease protein
MNASYKREVSILLAIGSLALVLAFVAPGYFTSENLSDLFQTNLPVLIVAVGITLVMLTGQIDVSSGSVFAVCSVVGGLVAKAGFSPVTAALGACAVGALLGAVNGLLVAQIRIPSIVVTLATMVSLRSALRWYTGGAWIQDLPAGFQWLGLSQQSYPVMSFILALTLIIVVAWILSNVAAGRAIYATGSNEEAARLAGIHTNGVVLSVFLLAGALTGFAAILNSVRFSQIPSNTGLGLEMKVIAAVVIGGVAVTGGAGTMVGTALGVILLGAIGPALTFMNVSAYWEKAIQGAIILAAIVVDVVQARSREHA